MLVFLLVFMQPLFILVDTAETTLSSVNTKHYGTDSDGNVVEVGDSIEGADIIIALLSSIGLAAFIGFILWASKGGRDPYDESIRRGGFQQ